jgi:hypothetical protein
MGRARAAVVVVMLTIVSSIGLAFTRAYFVEPRELHEGWTAHGPTAYVGQTFIANVDSISYIEWFVGEPSRAGHYRFEVRDAATSELVARGDTLVPDHGWRWVRCDHFPYGSLKFTKGREYILRVRQFENDDSVNFVYRTDNPYTFGHISVSGGELIPETNNDLVARIIGRMDKIDSTYWGVCPSFPNFESNTSDTLPNRWVDRCTTAGIAAARVNINWENVQPNETAWWFGWLHKHLEFIGKKAGCEIVGLLQTTAPWASSRIDTFGRWVDSAWVIDSIMPCVNAPPRNLFADVNSDTNYWARYIDSLVKHTDCVSDSLGYEGIHTWEIWNEPNDTAAPGPGFFRHPSPEFYTTVSRTAHGLCSLYMRMAEVAYSVIRSREGHGDDRILIGSLEGATTPFPLPHLVPGWAWLDTCYQVADDSTLWDAVSMHPYQPQSRVLDADEFEVSAETIRAIMRKHGHGDGELWNSEIGWDTVCGEDLDADALCAVFVTGKASGTRPRGGYDRSFWFGFREIYTAPRLGGHRPLLDSAMTTPYMLFYACEQMTHALTGKRLNGRVLIGDSAEDALARMYEFEDPASLKKSWVCWSTIEGHGGVVVRVPARSDTAASTILDYGDNPQPSYDQAAATGWLWSGITTRPVFITEPDGESLMRPDLVVDSFSVGPQTPQVGKEMGFIAYVRNADTVRATPDTVWYKFLCDTMLVDSFWGRRIDPGATDTIVMIGAVVPMWMRGVRLFQLQANPGQKFVERTSLDDNGGYSRNKVVRGPDGYVNIVASPACKMDAPILPLQLESHSWETDSTGQTPADSARVLFSWYGQRDSVVHAADTTAWFPFCTDTVLEFPRGCGVYRVAVQYRDSGQNDSPFCGDSTDSIVVFDSVPPAGSIVVEGGRFASNSMRTLRLTASDSASGICDMRFMNRGRVDLVENGAFTAGDNSWSFGNGEVDDSLRMARLTVGPVPATVTQFVPAESYSAYLGDSCVLEASILAHVHDDDATGSLSFWYFATRPDTWPAPETLYQLADSAGFSGRLLSLTGRSCLSKRFLLAQPDPVEDWVWRGGIVKVEASAENGNGNVWVDNASLNAFEPESAYAWWGPYDTLVAQWDIGSGAGMKVVNALFLDSAGTENAVPCADTVILDPTPPVVDISLPMMGQLVNGSSVEVTGWAYDPVEIAADTWFSERRLRYRHMDSTNWLSVSPDSISHVPAYPDSMASQGPAVHLGYWNTLGLEDGPYYLLLTASDSAGNTSSCTTWVMVDQGFGGGGMRSGPEGGGSGMGEGSVYVGSATGTVLHLSDDLDSLDAFSVSDSGSEANITAIVEVGEDSILVLDAHNKRVHKLHRSGQHRRRLVSGLSQPADLKRDANGNFWLVDRGWNRIGKFRSNGTLVFVRGGLGADSLHFHSPEGIAVKGGLVYVADGGNNRIAVWDTSGHFKTTITGDFENPTAVWVMESGAIYLTDGIDGKLKGITPLGGNIVTIGTADSSKLKGLVPSQNRHSLFSLASEPNKVYKLRIQSDESRPGGIQSGGRVNLPKTLALNQSFPNPARTKLNIAYALPRQTRVELKLYDVAGKLVTTLANGEHKPGYYNLTWNRQDTKGRSCASGIYFCTLAAENQRFSRKVILTE